MYKDIIQFNWASKTPSKFLTLILLLVLGSIFSVSVFAADDAYLKELEVEAEKSEQVSNKPKSGKASADLKEFKQFESALKTRRPAIFRFYKKLNKEDKTIIFSIYQEDQKFTRASKVVFDLYFDKNK